MFCPNCYQPLEDGAKFCVHCGTKIADANSDATTVLTEEPAPMETAAPQAEPAPVVDTPFYAEEPAPQADSPINAIKKKIPAKFLKFGGIAVAAIAIILIIALLLPGAGSTVNYVMFIKDDEIMISKKAGAKSWQVTDELLDFDRDEEEQNFPPVAYLGDAIKISEDGKKLFYVDKIDSDGEANIMYRPTSSAKKEPVRIASGVSSYQILPSGDCVFFLDNDNLYKHNLKDKEKIASDVSRYYVSDDGKTLYYVDDEDNLYKKSGNKDEEKIAKEIKYVEHISEDFSQIWYTKDDSLYTKKSNKDAEKILSDVSSVLSVYDSGEIYYTQEDEADTTLWKYVKDDMADADKNAVAPEEPEYPDYPDYPSYDDYDDYDDYYDAYDAVDDAYDEAVDKYYEEYEAYNDAYYEYREVEKRNELREELKNSKVTVPVYSLIYFDGKNETIISEDYSSAKCYGENSPLIIYSTVSTESVGTIKLSEIDSTWDVENMINGASSGNETYIVIGDVVSEFEHEDADNFEYSEEHGIIIYTAEHDSEDDVAELYKATVSGKKLKKAELVDDDVYTHGYSSSPSILSSSKILYYKDVKNDEGELYISGKSIDSDVYVSYSTTMYDEDADTVYYMTDVDDEEESLCGTLKKSTGKKAVKIYDDVNGYHVNYDGTVFFLYDYSNKHYNGDLYYCKGNKAKKIDSDVSCIIGYDYVTEEK